MHISFHRIYKSSLTIYQCKYCRIQTSAIFTKLKIERFIITKLDMCTFNKAYILNKSYFIYIQSKKIIDCVIVKNMILIKKRIIF